MHAVITTGNCNTRVKSCRRIFYNAVFIDVEPSIGVRKFISARQMFIVLRAVFSLEPVPSGIQIGMHYITYRALFLRARHSIIRPLDLIRNWNPLRRSK